MLMRWMATIRTAPAVLLAAALLGCGQAGSEQVKIQGTVHFQGSPVQHVRVTFHPEGGGNPALSKPTDSDGRYQAKVSEKKYRVAIVYQLQEPLPMGSPMGVVEAKWPIPIKYGDPAQSRLVIDVKKGGRTKFDFDLPE